MKIAIIGAMDEEVALLKENISGVSEETRANVKLFIGKMFGHDVVLLKSGIGKVNAALATAIAIERFQPDLLINTGSAGGLDQDLSVGDIVVSTEVRHHDVDATAFGYEYGQVPRMPTSFIADQKLVDLAYRCAEEIPGVKTVKGMIATGDSFMSDPRKVARVSENFRDVAAVEMEGAAIAQVAYQYGIPFVVIRSLSDIAGKDSAQSFEEFLQTAAENSATLIMKMLERM